MEILVLKQNPKLEFVTLLLEGCSQIKVVQEIHYLKDDSAEQKLSKFFFLTQTFCWSYWHSQVFSSFFEIGAIELKVNFLQMS